MPRVRDCPCMVVIGFTPLMPSIRTINPVIRLYRTESNPGPCPFEVCPSIVRNRGSSSSARPLRDGTGSTHPHPFLTTMTEVTRTIKNRADRDSSSRWGFQEGRVGRPHNRIKLAVQRGSSPSKVPGVSSPGSSRSPAIARKPWISERWIGPGKRHKMARRRGPGDCALAFESGCQGVSVWKVWNRPSVSMIGASGQRPLREIDGLGLRDQGGPTPMPGLAVAGLRDPDRVDPDALLARGVLSLRTGRATRRASREVAIRYDFDALADAEAALTALPDGPDEDPASGEPKAFTTRPSRISSASRAVRHGATGRILRDSLNAQGIRLTIETEGAIWLPKRFGEFLFADDFVVRGIGNQYRTQGIGVPLVAIREFPWRELEKRPGQDRFLMPRNLSGHRRAESRPPGKRPAWKHDGVSPGSPRHDPHPARRVRRSIRTAGDRLDHSLGLPLRSQSDARLAGSRPARSSMAGTTHRPLHAAPLRAGQDPHRARPRTAIQPAGLAQGGQ